MPKLASFDSKLPLFAFVLISLWWAFYYQSNSVINDFGNANFEWLYLLDALVFLPILCFLCIKDKKEALLKTLILACTAVLIGSYIIPEQNKFVWHYLEDVRYIVLAGIVVFELAVIVTLVMTVRVALLGKEDPDMAIQEPVVKVFGDGVLAQLSSFEIRMWSYALFAKRIEAERFDGDEYFTYHNKDGAQSSLLGFVCLIAFEMVLMHPVLHFLWSPLAANIITALTFLSLVFFFAEYRAIAKRPISIYQDQLIIRYGLFHPLNVPLGNINRVSKNIGRVRRSSQIKRYNYEGEPNVVIELTEPIGTVDRIYVGVDRPNEFISSLAAKLS